MPQHVLVIGAVALGPKAACRLKRLEPESRVTMIDKGRRISYGGCGIPYFVSGDVSDPDGLQTTSFHMLRDEHFFRVAKDIDVRTRTQALAIDRQAKRVLVRNLDSGEEQSLPYDKLVLATGSTPRRLGVPGEDLGNVFTVSNMEEAIAIRQQVTAGEVGKAVIIGGGFIGLEMAESLADMWDVETTIVDIAPQILPNMVSRDMAAMAQRHMEEKGVAFRLGESIVRLEGEDRVERVVTDKGVLEADLVIVSIGVIPASALAREAGLTVSARGTVVVDDRMRTSDPDIYAGGNLVEIRNLVTGKPGFYPLGSMANRQGRVIGTNLAGGDARFEGAVGSFAVKVFELSVAGAGLTLDVARREGFDAISVHVAQFDRAHFYPDKDIMHLELVVEQGTSRVLGIQGLGAGLGVVGRIDAVAAILKDRPTVDDISNLELAYSPPFSSAMDILNALGNVAENTLAGRNRTVDVDTFRKWWEERDKGEICFLDCRNWGNAGKLVEKYPGQWTNIPQDELRARLDEVPRDKRLVLICNTGVRSFEAQITLDQAGIRDSVNLEGGMAAVKKRGVDL